MPASESFSERVYDAVSRVPRGRVITYGQIARMIGAPKAARQVGWAMRRCPEGLPWHRVVRADGVITLPGREDGSDWVALRRALLEGEEIPFTPDGRVDVAACHWP